MTGTDLTFGDIVERNARLSPDHEALVDERVRLTFGKFGERARRLANVLAARGAKPGDRIAVLAQNGHETIETFAACEMAGYISAALSTRLTELELTSLIADCRPRALIFDHTLHPLVAKLRNMLPSVRLTLSVGGPAAGSVEYEEALAGASDGTPKTRAKADDTSYIIYTSGSTGLPKGVMHSHRSQITGGMSICLDGSVGPTDRLLIANPMTHAGGRFMQMAYHFRGATVVLRQHFDAGEFLADIEREQITATLLPATMMRAVLDHPDFARRDLSSLSTIYYSAGPTPEALVRRALGTFGPKLIQFYGMTECGGVGTASLKHQHTLDGPGQRRLFSAGQASPLGLLRIVRPDGSDCEGDELGEIIMRSDAVMQGYWNNQAATDELLRDGWLHTGDVGRFDAERFVYVVDRLKDMVKSGGMNVYSREVEDALHSHPAVQEAAVFGIPHEQWGETVHAVVVRRTGQTISDDDLIAHCRTRIASYKKPTAITFMDTLPRLDNGKVDKLALREPFWAGHERRVN